MTTVEEPHPVATVGLFAVTVGLAVGLAALADDVLPPTFVWGGTECSTTPGVTACGGVPPAGLVLTTLLAAAVVLAAYAAVTDGGADAR